MTNNLIMCFAGASSKDEYIRKYKTQVKVIEFKEKYILLRKNKVKLCDKQK